jgi:hypothetical protein
VKKPNWLSWGSHSTKSDNLKKVRQQTDQAIKRQQAQKELQGDRQEKEARQAPKHVERKEPLMQLPSILQGESGTRLLQSL